MVAGNADPKKEGRHMRKVDLQSQMVADGVFSDLVFNGVLTPFLIFQLDRMLHTSIPSILATFSKRDDETLKNDSMELWDAPLPGSNGKSGTDW